MKKPSEAIMYLIDAPIESKKAILEVRVNVLNVALSYMEEPYISQAKETLKNVLAAIALFPTPKQNEDA
jgi:hypothetical protein